MIEILIFDVSRDAVLEKNGLNITYAAVLRLVMTHLTHSLT